MKNSENRENAWICVIASLSLYVISLFWPALVFVAGDDVMTYPGMMCLINGPLSIFIFQITWLANPLWFLSVIKLARAEWRSAFRLSALALFCALDILVLFFQAFPGNEGGVGPWYKLAFLHIGFFFWTGSMFVVLLKAKMELKRADHNSHIRHYNEAAQIQR